MKVPEPRKLDSGSYFIQMRLNGVSVPVTASTAKECKRQAELIKAEHRAGKRQITQKTDKTLRQAIDEYIKRREAALSPLTVRGYNIIRDNRFQSVIDTPIKDIKDWQTICNIEGRQCSAKTLKNAIAFVRGVLKANDIMMPPVSLPTVPPTEKKFLDYEQIKVFVAAVKGERAEIPALLALHSLRMSEINALTWDNVDLKQGVISVSGAMVLNKDNQRIIKATNKNKTSTRTVPIVIPELTAALNAVVDKSGYVCQDRQGGVYDRINRICRKAGLPEVGVHGLRHSFASLAYHLNVPEKITMQIGGWSNPATMKDIYTHIAQKDITKYVGDFKDYFANENANGI